ncbi:ABC transporter permease [Rhizobium sophoriradicis]|uniref:ABC transporter permease n=1 Tax=Rhizobium sophoriradicis TaxID=1535245 RepID=UPI002477FE59|nr:ABC transporter permease subunit [Rhizobium sophoriradicis]
MRIGRVSGKIAIATGAAAGIGAAIATVLAREGCRCSTRLRSSLTMTILTPIIFPVIVVGVAAYPGLSRLGLVGTSTGIILGQTIGAIGYVVVVVLTTLSGFDRRLEQAAMSMRAGPAQTFMRMTLPLIRSGIIGGALFAFLASFDEVIITTCIVRSRNGVTSSCDYLRRDRGAVEVAGLNHPGSPPQATHLASSGRDSRGRT